MAVVEKSISGSISAETLSGSMSACPPLSGTLKMPRSTVEKDYENLKNKPSINGVELVSDKSFEDLGDHVLTNFEILELMKNAGF